MVKIENGKITNWEPNCLKNDGPATTGNILLGPCPVCLSLTKPCKCDLRKEIAELKKLVKDVLPYVRDKELKKKLKAKI